MKKFGNWEVTNDGIIWTSVPIGYFVPREEIHDGGFGERENVYDWLVHLPGKTWLSRKDIMDLNEAYLYAFDYYDIGEADHLSWEETMRQQEEVLQDKD